MALSQERPKRKLTGGIYQDHRKKKSFYLASQPAHTKIGKKIKRTVKTLGGHKKVKLLAIDKVNLYNPETKKFELAAIKTVVDNPANRHFIRRNIMTKGTIVETEKGKARITSRPGQEGTLNAVLIK